MRKGKEFKLKGGIKDISHTWRCLAVSVLAVAQIVIFLLWQYKCATNWEPGIRVVRAEEANFFISRRDTGYCTE